MSDGDYGGQHGDYDDDSSDNSWFHIPPQLLDWRSWFHWLFSFDWFGWMPEFAFNQWWLAFGLIFGFSIGLAVLMVCIYKNLTDILNTLTCGMYTFCRTIVKAATCVCC